MDRNSKWIFFLIVVLVVTLSLIVYLAFYSESDVELSPALEEESSTEEGSLIIDERGGNFGIEPEEEKENNQTNSSYWIQDLPDGGGAMTITPLIIYDKLGKSKGVAWSVLIVIVMVLYIAYRVKGTRKTDEGLTARYT